MRRTKFEVVFSMVAVVSTAMAEEKPAISPAVPPLLRKVFRIDRHEGVLLVTNRTVRFVADPLAINAKGDDKGQTLARTIYKPVYEERIGDIVLDSAEIFEAGGKKLAREDVLKRVAAGMIVVISADGKPVDPAYLQTLAKDTLVLVSPPYALQASLPVNDGSYWSVYPISGHPRTSRESPPKP